MIDLHCHILPGVDDGARTIDEALEMAHMALHSGVHTLVATPHHRHYGHDNHAKIREAFDRLQDALEYEQIPLDVRLATEVWVRKGELPPLTEGMTYPNSPWFLVEFSTDASAAQIQTALEHYVAQGFRPVIAHPERYAAIQEEPIIARTWVQAGWGVQVNRDSLLGYFGERCYYCADCLLRHGWANLIASDAHRIDTRNTDWNEALETLHHRYDGQLLRRCLHDNPAKILRGEAL